MKQIVRSLELHSGTDKEKSITQQNFLFCRVNEPKKHWANRLASSRKVNLRRDLRWVAKRTCKFRRKYSQGQTYPVFLWLTWVG